MSQRDEMLGRIRAALHSSGRSGQGAIKERLEAFPGLGKILPPVPPDKLLANFEAEFQRVGGLPFHTGSVRELQRILKEIYQASGAGDVVISRNPLLAELKLTQWVDVWGKPPAVWPRAARSGSDPSGALSFKDASFSAGLGITGVDFVLAESGSLVLTSRTEGSQLASLAPPIHVALYRREQVIESLEEVLSHLPLPRDPGGSDSGRSVVLITGSSRTADIEQITIPGVHGPQKVYAILVEESCLAPSGGPQP